MFVNPPVADESTSPVTYTYDSFPSNLDYDLFPFREPPPTSRMSGMLSSDSADKRSFVARRSKAEVKAALKVSARASE